MRKEKAGRAGGIYVASLWDGEDCVGVLGKEGGLTCTGKAILPPLCGEARSRRGWRHGKGGR